MWFAGTVTGLEQSIYLPDGAGRPASVGVFLGIHGDRWVENAIASVERQEVATLSVVAGLNGPSSTALEQLLKWQASSRHAITVVVNDRNLGPLGSWHCNRDLLTAPWVALMHQDDVYLPNHVSYLLAAAEAASESVLAVFAAMSGIDELGRPTAAPPMDNEFLDLAPMTTSLPAILRRHPLPTPAVMLRSPLGYVHDLAWYDSGAPDSEWFARLACRGRFRVLQDVTVLYRTASGSESQSTGWRSRAWQWAHSLDRLIHSEDFAKAIQYVSPESRAFLADELLAAIPARYPTSPVFEFLAFSAAQRMASTWQYEPGPATELLAYYLTADPGSAATRNLTGITGVPASEPAAEAARAVRQLLGEPPTRGRLEESGRTAYLRFGHLLPQRTRMAAYRFYDRLWSHRGAR